MDPLTGALIAAGVGWTSIAIVAYAPGIDLPVQAIRPVGAITIGILALLVLGAPIDATWPLVFLAGGLFGAWQATRVARRPATDASHAEHGT